VHLDEKRPLDDGGEDSDQTSARQRRGLGGRRAFATLVALVAICVVAQCASLAVTSVLVRRVGERTADGVRQLDEQVKQRDEHTRSLESRLVTLERLQKQHEQLQQQHYEQTQSVRAAAAKSQLRYSVQFQCMRR